MPEGKIDVEKNTPFGDDAENYDRMRPRYCPELFSAVWDFSGMTAGVRVLEIGPGPGQATVCFWHKGCLVSAVAMDVRLANYCREKFSEFPGFRVVNLPFESYEAEEAGFSLVYSATAFHWVPEETGYPKVHSLLKEGGTLALFWNSPFPAREDDPLHSEIQRAYRKYRPSEPPRKPKTDRYCSLALLERYGFSDGLSQCFFQTRRFDAENYIALLNTYSDHCAMPVEARIRLEEEIRTAIEETGSMLTVCDMMELYLAKKR